MTTRMNDQTGFPDINTEPTNFDPVEKCIYCFEANNELTTEHIIPFSLGGILTLPKSSCRSCATITSKAELAVSRYLFGNLRSKYKLPTRRKKLRPKEIEMKFRNEPEKVNVPIENFPTIAFMYQFTNAGILESLPEDVDISKFWKPVVFLKESEVKELRDKHSKDPIFEYRHYHLQFARTIAKIGYSYGVALLGIDSFIPLAPKYILNDKENISYIVGGTGKVHPPVTNSGHMMELEIIQKGNEILIIVNIRLFSSNETPSYHVIIGKVTGDNEMKEFLKHFDASVPTSIS